MIQMKLNMNLKISTALRVHVFDFSQKWSELKLFILWRSISVLSLTGACFASTSEV
jgi:hypothetical protein